MSMPIPAAPRRLCTVALLLGALAAGSALAAAADPLATAIDAGDLRTAAIMLKDRLQRDPADGEARLQLARIYLRLGNGEAAEKELGLAASAGIVPDRRRLLQVEVDLLEGRNREALESLAMIEPQSGEQAQVQALTGRARLALDQAEEARAAFAAAAKLDPNNEAAAVGLLSIANREGPDQAAARTDALLARFPRSDEALLIRAHLHMKTGEPRQAAELFGRVLAQNPTSVAALGGRAVARIAQGELTAAGEDIETLAGTRRAAPLANYLSAVIALKRNDPRQAREALQAVLAANPKHPQSRYLMGVLALQQGQLETALGLFGTLYRELPHNRTLAKALAATYLELGEPRQAVETLAPLADGADPQTQTLLGVAYLQSGSADRGIRSLQSALGAAPQLAGLRPRLALSLAAAGDLEGAEGQLETELSLKPDSAEAGMLLTLTRIGKRDYDSALRSAAQLVALDPKAPIGYLATGMVYLDRGDTRDAANWFGKALAADPKGVAARGNLARVALAEHDPDTAARYLEEIAQIDPGNLDALLGLIDLAADKRDALGLRRWVEQARNAAPDALEPGLRLVRFYLAQGDGPAARAAAEDLAARFPDDRGVAFHQAAALRMAGDTRGAAGILVELAKREPGSAAVQLALGQARLAMGEIEPARESFEKALAGDPGSRDAKVALAAALWQGGDSERTLALARDLQMEFPADPAGYRIEGDVQLARGDYASAAPALRESLSRQRNAAVARSLAESLYRSGSLAQAVSTLEDWLKQDPSDHKAKAMLALYYQESGRRADAIALFQDMDFGNPPDPLLINNLAWMLQEAGDPRALDLARKAYDLMPSRPEIADTYSWILIKSGQARQAIGILQQALLAQPANPDLTYRLALAYDADGGKDQAARLLHDLVSRHPSAATAADARTLLKRLEN